MKLGFNGKPISRKRQDVMSVLKEQAMLSSKNVEKTSSELQDQQSYLCEPTMMFLQQQIQQEVAKEKTT
jgi:hypothetical protein